MIHPLDTLWNTVTARTDADPSQSYTATLRRKGLGRIAQKVGEEAIETAIEAARLEAGTGTAEKLAGESADLLYHLFVLWSAAGIVPAQVYDILEKRQAMSGLDEKNSRQQP